MLSQFVRIGLLAIVCNHFFFARAAIGQAEKKTINNFADWWIERVDSNKSYMLVGVGEVKGDTRNFLGFRYFWIQCFEGYGKFSVALPYDKRPDSRAAKKTILVSVWSDRAKPKDVQFLMLNPAILIVMSDQDDDVGRAAKDFIQVLLNSDKRFSFGFEEKSVHFDMADFKAAWSKFSQYCAR